MADDRVVQLAGVGVALLVLFGAGFLIGTKRALKLHSAAIKERVDTIYHIDTIVAEKPIYLTKYVDRVQLVPVRDTLRVKDTLYVAMERERVEWRDEYAAVYASGIEPAVDSVKHFIKERVITQTIQVPAPQRWKRIGWGVAVGPGVYWQPGMDNVTPGLGITVGLRVNL